MPERRGRRQRVVIWLDVDQLERLEAISRHRHGPRSRSEVVREAIEWLLAKEAGWLMRAEHARQKRADEARDQAERLALPREQFDARRLDEVVDDALRIVGRDGGQSS